MPASKEIPYDSTKFESRNLVNNTVLQHTAQQNTPGCIYLFHNFPNSIQSKGLRWPPWYEQSPLNSRSNAHCDGAAMAPLCKLVKRGAVRANDLPLSNDLEAWPDSSVGRGLDVQCQGSRVRIPLGSVIFSHFHFSYMFQWPK